MEILWIDNIYDIKLLLTSTHFMYMQCVLFNHDPLRMQEINTNVELFKLLINLIYVDYRDC